MQVCLVTLLFLLFQLSFIPVCFLFFSQAYLLYCPYCPIIILFAWRMVTIYYSWKTYTHILTLNKTTSNFSAVLRLLWTHVLFSVFWSKCPMMSFMSLDSNYSTDAGDLLVSLLKSSKAGFLKLLLQHFFKPLELY